ncbi:cytochrome P450 [Bacillus sp. SG-1]|uniref:cytochrome P450 n=1 Tax=Bacillus sp. SG-1 TaxID=161544 RepID=UPI0002D7D626|nr:cytochrome P450 [Bacillus sp. SG-1]
MEKAKTMTSLHPLGLLNNFRDDPLMFLDEMRTSAEDLVSFRFANRRVHLLLNPELIKEVLVTKAASFQKSKQFQELHPLLGEGLLTSEGPKHREQRKLIQPFFTHRHIENYINDMIDVTEKAIGNMSEHETRNVSKDMMEVTLAIISKTMFAMDIEEGHEKVGKPLEVAMETATKRIRSFIKLPLSFPSKEIKDYVHAINQLKDVVENVITTRESQKERYPDLLDALIHAKSDEGEGMPREQLQDELMTLTLAGHETTANLLTWCLYALAKNEGAKRKLYREIDRVLGTKRITSDDLPRLTYTKQVLQEALRLYPPAWMFGRIAIEDESIGDYSVKKGENILVSPYVMHQKIEYFEEPLAFKPERFLEKQPPYAYFPFGGGPRVCIGNHFALQEATIILAMLVQKFDVCLDPGSGEPDFEPLITLRPKNGLFLRMVER